MKKYPLYIGGESRFTDCDLNVYNKFSSEKAAVVSLAGKKELEEATQLAVSATDEMKKMTAASRRAVLDFCVEQFIQRKEELAQSLCIEAGKPIRDSRGEVERLIETFRIAAEECVRIGGEYMPLDRTEASAGYTSITKRVPIGPCFFITPFNFPLNLVAHKVAPAIAAGCPFVLKPASRTPIGALIIGEILAKSGLPKGAFSVVPCARDVAANFIGDERFKLLSFTGSQESGWDLKAKAGRKKVSLELGGNAAVVIDEGADLQHVVSRILTGAFYQSGQSCISVQRIIAHESLYSELKALLVKGAEGLICGDPAAEETFVGPLIDASEVERLNKWIVEAQLGGALILCGGEAVSPRVFPPTLLEDVPEDCELFRKEAFGPVAFMSSFANFSEALEQVNNSDYGLQAGVFTNDINRAWQAWDELEVGGVVVGDVPSWRADQMPYGGVKQSGFGREGLRWSIEEMTEMRLLVLKNKNSF